MKNSNIQWTDHTWNIARGCTKVDEDCKFCYMYRDSMEGTRYNPKAVIQTKTVFDLPLRIKPGKSNVWDGPQLVFVSSLTDWAHPDCDPFRARMWEIIRMRQDLIFQCLTKRTERLAEVLPPDWGNGYPNVWLGTSVGGNKGRNRMDELCKVPAMVRFVSFEPLYERILSPIPFKIEGTVMHAQIQWAIVGGESGNDKGKYRYRPCDLSWIGRIVGDAFNYRVPVFVKQLGTHLAKELNLKDRHGGNMDEWPELFKIRQFPKIN